MGALVFVALQTMSYQAYLAGPPINPWTPAMTQVSTPSWFGGRIYTSPTLHVGVRGACVISNSDDGIGVGATLQISF